MQINLPPNEQIQAPKASDQTPNSLFSDIAKLQTEVNPFEKSFETKQRKRAMSSSGIDETEEEKRRSFLERNRLAALKCRKKKKEHIAFIENRVEELALENQQLKDQVLRYREEILNLKAILMAKDTVLSPSVSLPALSPQLLSPSHNVQMFK